MTGWMDGGMDGRTDGGRERHQRANIYCSSRLENKILLNISPSEGNGTLFLSPSPFNHVVLISFSLAAPLSTESLIALLFSPSQTGLGLCMLMSF